MKGKEIDRWTEKVHVIMEWDMDAELTTTEGNGMQCVGWIANYGHLLAQCTPEKARFVSVARAEGADGE